jgi:hypothetical protein
VPVPFTLTGMLDVLGVDYTQKTNRLSIVCPFHPDTDPSSGFYLDTNRFFCFACELTLDVVGFYARFKEIRRDAAEAELEKLFGSIPMLQHVDRMLVGRLRAAAEEELKRRKDWPRQVHAAFGERLDKIIWYYEKKAISDEQIEPAFNRWYSDLEGEDGRHTDCMGTTRDRVHDGLKERVRDLSWIGRKTGNGGVGKVPTGTADGLPPQTVEREPTPRLSGRDDEVGFTTSTGRPVRGEQQFPEGPDGEADRTTGGRRGRRGTEEVPLDQTHYTNPEPDVLSELE